VLDSEVLGQDDEIKLIRRDLRRMSFGLSFYLCISDREVEIPERQGERIGDYAQSDFTTETQSHGANTFFQGLRELPCLRGEMYIITSERGI